MADTVYSDELKAIAARLAGRFESLSRRKMAAVKLLVELAKFLDSQRFNGSPAFDLMGRAEEGTLVVGMALANKRVTLSLDDEGGGIVLRVGDAVISVPLEYNAALQAWEAKEPPRGISGRPVENALIAPLPRREAIAVLMEVVADAIRAL